MRARSWSPTFCACEAGVRVARRQQFLSRDGLTKTKQEHMMFTGAGAPAFSVLFESSMLCASVDKAFSGWRCGGNGSSRSNGGAAAAGAMARWKWRRKPLKRLILAMEMARSEFRGRRMKDEATKGRLPGNGAASR